ncbi:MAG: hypothetical protein Tp1111DCM843611_9 [Prokaryotic dsDNA virus sp.]|nr:MAG: hypothetical protein Tp1111DCM843611_9 [Prokaryotic dsDNA virus sp.]|tara:strand:+ start:22972 stop:23451 length:480 start_codon:yes stop_codon:yes gene_type:complete
MIQAVTELPFDAYITTEDTRIDNSVSSDKIRHLVKFTNDMDKSVQYAYSTIHEVYDRYTKLSFTYNATPDVYTGATKLIPAGYYKYQVYEVSWSGAVAISAGNAPINENDVLPVGPTHGVVQGLVAIGKLYMADKDGTAQVQYTQRQEPDGSNYIYYGQ